MSKQTEALKLALEALERVNANPSLEDWHHAFDEEVVAIREALAEQPAHQEPEKDWGAVAEKHLAALKQSSKAITEEAAVNAVHKMAQARGLIDIGRIFTPEKEQPYPDNFIDALKYDVARRDSEAQQCRTDGRCQYAIDSGAEGMGHCPKGKCVMPAQQQCKGIPRKGCNYLTACDTVCNKCGEIHHHHQMVANFDAPASKPLTDEEIVQIELGLRQYNNRDTYDLSLKDFARAIEAAHGIIGEQK